MEREWVEAGYFIISGSVPLADADSLLPASIVTVSTCIVDSYPDSWALPWVETSEDELLRVRESLLLDDSEFAHLRAWVERAMGDQRFGWPNVFMSLGAAQEFKKRFLEAVPEARIVGLSFAADVAAEFLRDEAPQHEQGASGVWMALSHGVPLKRNGVLLGFDVLGAEWGGSFHTFTCNGLQRDFHRKLGITFNDDGLIGEYSAAVLASEYTNSDEVGAELVPWYPARLDAFGR